MVFDDGLMCDCVLKGMEPANFPFSSPPPLSWQSFLKYFSIFFPPCEGGSSVDVGAAAPFVNEM
jgi:hypothetical protein